MYVVHNHIENEYSSSLHGVKCLGPALSQSQTVVVNFRLNFSNVFLFFGYLAPFLRGQFIRNLN